ncbi:MAG: PH domain-containing protein [Candidatus Thorarchaeota archaeon]|jgi:membrane protein YdbS with pleckstrin-like domain
MSSEGKVIKPPIEDVESGKVFKPSKAFRNKNWFLMIFAAVGIWLIFITFMFGIGYLVFGLLGSAGFQGWVDVFWNLINPWYWLLTAIWFIPAAILYPIYINAFEYSVIAESGETMPEVYVKKGLINITRKHVPLRTIVRVATRAGPFDRIFGIGTVEIETAGTSGAQVGGSGAEERLEGIVFFEELRDFILRELRRFKDPYVTGTEVVLPQDDSFIRVGSSIEEEVLKVLEDIRNLLRDRS